MTMGWTEHSFSDCWRVPSDRPPAQWQECAAKCVATRPGDREEAVVCSLCQLCGINRHTVNCNYQVTSLGREHSRINT